MVEVAAAILAAGKSTRMKSALPKVLHPIVGRPMVQYVVEAALGAGAQEIVVVVGSQGRAVRGTLGDMVGYAEQREQLGTGHALLQARDSLAQRAERVLVLYGDMPLVTADTLRRLIDRQRSTGAPIVVLTGTVEDPSGMGRIVRDGGGLVERIVEDREATEGEREIREVNTGIYCFDAGWLWLHLAGLPTSRGGELYLTDTIALARAEGKMVESVECGDTSEAMGINNRLQLSEAETAMQRRICARLMLAGVTIVDPFSTRIEPGVRIGTDTVILPGTAIEGKCDIGANCRIGPDAIVRDSVVGDGAKIVSSQVVGARVASGAAIGPFACINPGVQRGLIDEFGN